MSIEQGKLFHFVSKLIFGTKRGEIEWQKLCLPPFKEKWTDLKDFPEEYDDLLCYCSLTPDAKKLWFFVHSRSKNGWLELRNREAKLELTIDMLNYGRLSNLYQAIREKEDGGDLHAAEETIDLILNGSKEQ